MKKGLAINTTVMLIAGALFVGLLLLILFLLKSESFPLLEKMTQDIVKKLQELLGLIQ